MLASSAAPSLVIQFEKVADTWQELEALATQELIEVEDQRTSKPDWQSMRILNEQGIFQVLTARVNGKMVGYFSWLLDFDLESKGTLIANQSAWFVEPRHPIVGVRMLDRAIEEWKKVGAEFVYLHHGIKGRGANLGRLFERRGAKLLSHNYILNMKAKVRR